MKVCGLVQASDLAESTPLCLQALLDFLIVIDLHEMGSHYLPPAFCGDLILRCETPDERIAAQETLLQKRKEWKATKL
jgi:hypothetical protein